MLELCPSFYPSFIQGCFDQIYFIYGTSTQDLSLQKFCANKKISQTITEDDF